MFSQLLLLLLVKEQVLIMNKILFLDFDDVIATEKSRYNLDKECCDRIQKIVDAIGCKIVISSSWRRGSLKTNHAIP